MTIARLALRPMLFQPARRFATCATAVRVHHVTDHTAEVARLTAAGVFRSAMLPGAMPLAAKSMIGQALERTAHYDSQKWWTYMQGGAHYNAAIVDLMAGMEKEFHPKRYNPLTLPLRIPGQHPEYPNAEAWLEANGPENEGELVCAKRFHPAVLTDCVSIEHHMLLNHNYTFAKDKIEEIFRLNLDASEEEAQTLMRQLAKRVDYIAAQRQAANSIGVLNLISLPSDLARNPKISPLYRSHVFGAPCTPLHLDTPLELTPHSQCPCGLDSQVRFLGSWLAKERVNLHVHRISPFPDSDASSTAQINVIARAWKIYDSLRHKTFIRKELAAALATAETDVELDRIAARFMMAKIPSSGLHCVADSGLAQR